MANIFSYDDHMVYRFGDLEDICCEVSCLMAIYSGDDPDHLALALDSIGQQVNAQFETVLVFDGVVSGEIQNIVRDFCKSMKNSTTVIETNENNGLAAALNLGLQYCRSDLVARFDADDVSKSTRLSQQLKYMRVHPWVDVLGTCLEILDNEGALLGEKFYPHKHSSIKRLFFLKNPIAHPSVMFRREKILNIGGYPEFRKAQDYALWGRCMVNGLYFNNLPQSLVQMRTGNVLFERRGRTYFLSEAAVLKFLFKIKCITRFQYIVAYTVRFISREFNQLRIEMRQCSK